MISLLPVVPVQAQSADGDMHPVAYDGANALLDGSYILGAGDAISVEDDVMGEVTNEQIKILADGSVDLPLVGQVTLAGLSLDEAQAVLNEKFGEYYVSPAIILKVEYQHPVRVYVQGAVNNPGIYASGKNIKPTHDEKFELGAANQHYFFYKFYLTDALIQAGGLKHTANLKDIKIFRTFPKAQTIHVNLWELFKSGAIIQDVPLHEHDMIVVSDLPADALVNNQEWETVARSNLGKNLFNINVIGAVKQPGTYQISNQDSVLTAIAEAGGFDELANQKKVFLLRTNRAGQVFKKEINVSDAAMKGKKGTDKWMALLPEDVIFVDDSNAKKGLNFGKSLLNKSTGAAMLPFFTNLLREDN